LEFALCSGRTWKAIIDKDYSVAHEDVVFDGDAFADEGVAGNLAVSADLGVFLDLDKSADFCVVVDLTAVQINKWRELYVLSQSDVGSYALMLVHSRIICPLFSND
jgi:hypothetical protein